MGIQAKGMLAHRTSRGRDRPDSDSLVACFGRFDVPVRIIRHALGCGHFYRREVFQRPFQQQGPSASAGLLITLFAGS